MIVANSEGIKREAKLPIEICIDRTELYTLYNALKVIVENDNNGHPWVYGWVDIPLNARPIPNTKPLDWNEAAK